MAIIIPILPIQIVWFVVMNYAKKGIKKMVKSEYIVILVVEKDMKNKSILVVMIYVALKVKIIFKHINMNHLKNIGAKLKLIMGDVYIHILIFLILKTPIYLSPQNTNNITTYISTTL
ncbi:hypothetical protein RB653_009861 [Dictyostelium firmibasis]|uniref:Uncharacterized protein n=1 Tax=Dictyostelium firmibasis TaxID=79012 RepID=A0AAN7U021_9MYCE